MATQISPLQVGDAVVMARQESGGQALKGELVELSANAIAVAVSEAQAHAVDMHGEGAWRLDRVANRTAYRYTYTYYGSTYYGSTYYGSTYYDSTYYGSTYYGSAYSRDTWYGYTCDAHHRPFSFS
jgi:hypothetical protein